MVNILEKLEAKLEEIEKLQEETEGKVPSWAETARELALLYEILALYQQISKERINGGSEKN